MILHTSIYSIAHSNDNENFAHSNSASRNRLCIGMWGENCSIHVCMCVCVCALFRICRHNIFFVCFTSVCFPLNFFSQFDTLVYQKQVYIHFTSAITYLSVWVSRIVRYFRSFYCILYYSQFGKICCCCYFFIRTCVPIFPESWLLSKTLIDYAIYPLLFLIFQQRQKNAHTKVIRSLHVCLQIQKGAKKNRFNK